MLTMRRRGYTLVEVLVGITVLAILIGLGAPAMGTFLQNSKIANATQEFYSGIQSARTDAIRRNAPVQFVLTSTAVSTSNLANALTTSATGANWVVRAASDVTGGPFTLVEAKSGGEGAFQGGAARSVDVVASGPTGFAGVIAFNGFGGTTDGMPYSIDVSNSAAGTCAAVGGPIRCRRINVTAGGRVTACDPAAGAGDSRACPP